MSVAKTLQEAVSRGLALGNYALADRVITLRVKIAEDSLRGIIHEPERVIATHREEKRRNTGLFGLFLMSFFAESENIVQDGFTGTGSAAKDAVRNETRDDICHVADKGAAEVFLLLIRLACFHLPALLKNLLTKRRGRYPS